MNSLKEKLFMELRQSKQEIENTLKNKNQKDWMTPILESELADICLAIGKMEKGTYGECELSGEIIPEDLLKMVPTIRSLEDSQKLNLFCRKPISAHF